MSFKLHAAMAVPRRFDLTMSRRTRRPPAAAAATSATDRQAVDVEGLLLGFQFQPVVLLVQEPAERQDPDGLFCLSDHLQSRRPDLDDAHQEHDTSEEQRSEDTTITQEQAASSPPQQTCRRLVEKDDESEEEECQDNSRRFSLQELIEDEAVDGGAKDAATAEGEAKRPGQGQQVAGRRVIGIMRRYVKVRSIKPKRASPEKNATPVC